MNKKQYLVIGLGRFGSSVASTLYENGHDVMALDQDADLVDAMQNRVTHAAQLDATDAEALEALGARDFDVAIVSIGEDIKASSVVTMLLKELGVGLVVAKAHDDLHARILRKVGADRIIFPERDMGRRVAYNLADGNILDYIEVSSDFSMLEISPRPEWLGKPLAQLNLRKNYGLNVIAIRRDEAVNVSIDGDTAFRRDDLVLVVGAKDAVAGVENSGR